jgi:hypothetical protein
MAPWANRKVPAVSICRAVSTRVPQARRVNAAPTLMRLTRALRQVRHTESRTRHAHHHIDGLRQRIADRSDDAKVIQAGRIEDIGARSFEGLQSQDHAVPIKAVPEQIFGAGRQHEIPGQGATGLGRGLDALEGQVEAEDGIIVMPGMVLDRAAGEARLRRGANDLGEALRRISQALFEVGRDLERCRRGDGAAMGELSSRQTCPWGVMTQTCHPSRPAPLPAFAAPSPSRHWRGKSIPAPVRTG